MLLSQKSIDQRARKYSDVEAIAFHRTATMKVPGEVTYTGTLGLDGFIIPSSYDKKRVNSLRKARAEESKFIFFKN